MFKENNPLLSDDFLDKVVKEINQLFGGQNQMEDWSLKVRINNNSIKSEFDNKDRKE